MTDTRPPTAPAPPAAPGQAAKAGNPPGPKVAALVAAVRGFTAAHGRAPSFAETCELMGWTPAQGRRELAAIRPALTNPPPPAGQAGRSPTARAAATPPPRPAQAANPKTPGTSKPPKTTGSTKPAGTKPAGTKTAGGRKRAAPTPAPVPVVVDGPIDLPHPREGARRRAWQWLVAHGETPTEAAVAGRVRSVAEAKQGAARRHAKQAEVVAAAVADGPAAAGWVAAYRAEHGHGPLWRELAVGMGWTGRKWRLRTEIIVALRQHGHVAYDHDIERSLDTPPPTTGTDVAVEEAGPAQAPDTEMPPGPPGPAGGEPGGRGPASLPEPEPPPVAAGGSGAGQARRLGLRAGLRVWVDGAPAGWVFEDSPAGLVHADGPGPVDVAVGFYATAGDLRAGLPGLVARAAPGGVVWVAWPRRTSGHRSDVTGTVVRDLAVGLGAAAGKTVPLDGDWSALRLRPAP